MWYAVRGILSDVLRFALTPARRAGSGQNDICDIIHKDYGTRVALVPEVATVLLAAGFPRISDIRAQRCFQRAVYHTQREFEDAERIAHPHRTLVCDRGAADAICFWPDGPATFYGEFCTSHQEELARYDAVLFLDSVAAAELPILMPSPSEGGNPLRIEDEEQCLVQNERLRALYEPHRRFYHVAARTSFMAKLEEGRRTFETILRQLEEDRRCLSA